MFSRYVMFSQEQSSLRTNYGTRTVISFICLQKIIYDNYFMKSAEKLSLLELERRSLFSLLWCFFLSPPHREKTSSLDLEPGTVYRICDNCSYNLQARTVFVLPILLPSLLLKVRNISQGQEPRKFRRQKMPILVAILLLGLFYELQNVFSHAHGARVIYRGSVLLPFISPAKKKRSDHNALRLSCLVFALQKLSLPGPKTRTIWALCPLFL
jgi:hypothetical protein